MRSYTVHGSQIDRAKNAANGVFLSAFATFSGFSSGEGRSDRLGEFTCSVLPPFREPRSQAPFRCVKLFVRDASHDNGQQEITGMAVKKIAARFEIERLLTQPGHADVRLSVERSQYASFSPFAAIGITFA